MRRRLMGWLTVVATTLSAGVVAAAPHAGASGGDVVVIGERVGSMSGSYLRAPAPTAGTPTAAVDAAAGKATFAVEDANGKATITLAWPLRLGVWQLGIGATEPEQRVSLTRGDRSCTFTTGTLTIRKAETTASGAVAALDADVTGACDFNSYKDYTGFAAAVRVGLAGENPVAIPRAEPAQFRGGALLGTTVRHVVTVSNGGAKPWHITSATVGDAQTSTPQFIVDPAADSCTGAILEPGEQCAVAVSTVARWSTLWEHLVLAGDGPTSLVVPIYLEGHDVIPAPSEVTLAPGRLTSTITWNAPATQPTSGYRVYDVTDGKRLLLAKIDKAATESRVPFHGPGRLALVAATGTYSESSDVVLEVPAVSSEVVADDWYGFSVAFPTDVPTVSGRETRFSRGDLDASDSRWVIPNVFDGTTQGLGVCPATTEVCTTILGDALPAPELLPREAVWLPDGTIAFLRDDASGTATLWVVRGDGSGLRKVADVPGRSQLAASPAGGEVVVHANTGSIQIERVRLSDGTITPVPGTSDVDGFTVSSQGLLVLERRVDRTASEGDRVTTVMKLDGTGARQLALPAGDNRQVTFDPSGTRVAFARYTAPYQSTVWVAATDGSGARQLSTRSAAWLDLSWSVDNVDAPAATLTGAAFTGKDATLTVGAADADDPSGSLTRQCRLDGATTWTACGPTLALRGLAAGSHTAYSRVTDPSGLVSTTAAHTWTVDTTVPTAGVVTPALAQTASPITVTWSAADLGGSGLASYDLRTRYASPYGKLGVWVYPASWQGLKAKSLRIALSAGYQHCFSVRSRDVAGNIGVWSPEKCTSMTLDDRSVSASRGWTRGTSSGYAFGTWTRAVTTGAYLSRTSIQGRQIGIVAATCPNCGVVDVYHAGVRIGRVSLYSSTTRTGQVKWLPLQSTTRTGTVVVKTLSARPVIFDGLVVRH